MISESGSVEAMLRTPSGFSPFSSPMDHQKVSFSFSIKICTFVAIGILKMVVLFHKKETQCIMYVI